MRAPSDLPDVIHIGRSLLMPSEVIIRTPPYGTPYVRKSALDAMTAERDALRYQLEKDQRMVGSLLARIEQNGNDSHATYKKVSAEREALKRELAEMGDDRDAWRTSAFNRREERDSAREALAKAQKDAQIGRLVRWKMASGNNVPVERCTITARDISDLAAQQETKT